MRYARRTRIIPLAEAEVDVKKLTAPMVGKFSKVMYHGSKVEGGSAAGGGSDFGAGAYWADEQDYAEVFGDVIYKARIEMDSVLSADDKQLSSLSKKITGSRDWQENEKLFSALKAAGINGIRHYAEDDSENELIDWTLKTNALMKEGNVVRTLQESSLPPGEEGKIKRPEALEMAKDVIGMLGVEYVDPSEVTTETEYVGDGKAIPVGSIRRGRDEVGDIDIIVTGPIDKESLRKDGRVSKLSGGDKQVNFIFNNGSRSRNVNLFSFTDPNTWGAALLHTTGPGDYNKRIRFVVPSRGFGKLSQNGLFDKEGKVLPSRTEAEVQKTLEITQREPNQRDSRSKPKKVTESRIPSRLPMFEDYIHYSQRASQLTDQYADSVKDITKSGSQDRRDIAVGYVDVIKKLVDGDEPIADDFITLFSKEFAKYDIDLKDAIKNDKWGEIAAKAKEMGDANKSLEDFVRKHSQGKEWVFEP
jgi:hypothetical protein